jgi:hypothetical protein
MISNCLRLLILRSACSTRPIIVGGWIRVRYLLHSLATPFHSPTLTAHNVHRLLSWNLNKLAKKTVQKHFSNEMKILSSLKTRIYPKWFPDASAVTWSLDHLITRKLANKIEQFWKCDDFSGEITQLSDNNRCTKTICFTKNPRRESAGAWLLARFFYFASIAGILLSLCGKLPLARWGKSRWQMNNWLGWEFRKKVWNSTLMHC